jgi:hypothetical protein
VSNTPARPAGVSVRRRFGKALFYAGGETLIAAEVLTGGGFSIRSSTRLFEHPGLRQDGNRVPCDVPAAVGRCDGARYPDHEITNNLTDDLTTTSTGKPPPTPLARGKLDTNARIRMSRYEIYSVRQPSIAAPAPCQQASDPAQPAKQKIPNRPDLSEPKPNQHVTAPPHPAPSSATEIPGRGMASRFRNAALEETCGFSHPSKP